MIPPNHPIPQGLASFVESQYLGEIPGWKVSQGEVRFTGVEKTRTACNQSYDWIVVTVVTFVSTWFHKSTQKMQSNLHCEEGGWYWPGMKIWAMISNNQIPPLLKDGGMRISSYENPVETTAVAPRVKPTGQTFWSQGLWSITTSLVGLDGEGGMKGLVLVSWNSTKLGGGFKDLFFFLNLDLEKCYNLTNYFSIGLKPPHRKRWCVENWHLFVNDHDITKASIKIVPIILML